MKKIKYGEWIYGKGINTDELPHGATVLVAGYEYEELETGKRPRLTARKAEDMNPMAKYWYKILPDSSLDVSFENDHILSGMEGDVLVLPHRWIVWKDEFDSPSYNNRQHRIEILFYGKGDSPKEEYRVARKTRRGCIKTIKKRLGMVSGISHEVFEGNYRRKPTVNRDDAISNIPVIHVSQSDDRKPDPRIESELANIRDRMFALTRPRAANDKNDIDEIFSIANLVTDIIGGTKRLHDR